MVTADIVSVWNLPVSYGNQKRAAPVATINKGNDGKGQCSSGEEQHPPPRQTFNTAAVAADARAFAQGHRRCRHPTGPLEWAADKKTKGDSAPKNGLPPLPSPEDGGQA